MGREGRDYWEAQLSEYWDSGLTIQEYSELKELPYESTRRWIRVLQKARQFITRRNMQSKRHLLSQVARRCFTTPHDNSGRTDD